MTNTNYATYLKTFLLETTFKTTNLFKKKRKIFVITVNIKCISIMSGVLKDLYEKIIYGNYFHIAAWVKFFNLSQTAARQNDVNSFLACIGCQAVTKRSKIALDLSGRGFNVTHVYSKHKLIFPAKASMLKEISMVFDTVGTEAVSSVFLFFFYFYVTLIIM